MDIETFDLHFHALILYVYGGFFSKLLCIHIVDMGTFDLHGLTLCVPEAFLYQLVGIHNVDMGTFDLHGLILKGTFTCCFVVTVRTLMSC